jgi:phage host-nuclease inhibitor protein Gam
MTFILSKIRIVLQHLAGVETLQQQIADLQRANSVLEESIKDHETAISYISVLQVKSMRDMLSFMEAFNGKKKVQILNKKTDDDLIN